MIRFRTPSKALLVAGSSGTGKYCNTLKHFTCSATKQTSWGMECHAQQVAGNFASKHATIRSSASMHMQSKLHGGKPMLTKEMPALRRIRGCMLQCCSRWPCNTVVTVKAASMLALHETMVAGRPSSCACYTAAPKLFTCAVDVYMPTTLVT